MTLVRQVDRMEEAGWIERRPDPADRRARKLFLTDKARPVLDRIWDVATKTQNEALLHLSQEDANRLISLLHQVHGTLADRILAPAASRRRRTRSAAAAAPRRRCIAASFRPWRRKADDHLDTEDEAPGPARRVGPDRAGRAPRPGRCGSACGCR